jgi:hypothetical protein
MVRLVKRLGRIWSHGIEVDGGHEMIDHIGFQACNGRAMLCSLSGRALTFAEDAPQPVPEIGRSRPPRRQERRLAGGG